MKNQIALFGGQRLQMNESIQLTISDLALSGLGNTYKLTGLTFLVGTKKGDYKIGSTYTFPV